MKITDIEAIPLTLGETRAIADGTQDALIVRVHTDEGIVGIGESDSSPMVVKAVIEAPMSHMICRGLRTILVGENPFEVERLWEKMYRQTIFFGRRGAAIHAMSAVDIALWDIMGKALGKPVYELLGGAYRKEIRAYASALFGDTPEETAEITTANKEKGFTAIKLGWGPLGKDPEEDVRHIRLAREAMGDEMDLMVDAGLVWDAKTAIQMARRFEEYRIFWLEEPLPPDDLEGYAKVATAVDTRIAAGEEESTRWGFKDLMDRGKIDVVQVDVTRAGGLTESKRIAYMAHERNLPCVPHLWSSDIIIAASLHLVASIPNALILEYCMADSPLRWELVANPPKYEKGVVYVPEGPGLGIELNEDTLEKYRIKE